MSYLENRKEEIIELHKIYSSEIPEFLHKYLEVQEILRLNKIGQNCGLDYVNIPYVKPKYFYSRLDHSFGVALIIWHFTKDKKQTLAGLFHDIATPVFAHVVDFLKGDYLNQEHTERDTKNIIASSKLLMDYLKQDNIELDEVCDYKIYPIADNKSPKLSSDRLEYSFATQLIYEDCIKLHEMRKIYNSLVIQKNELNQDEISFNNAEVAEEFVNVSIKNGMIMSSYADNYAMEFLANILKIMVKNNELVKDELYTLNEEQIIRLIEKSSYDSIKKAWNFYVNLKDIKTSIEPIKDKFCLKLDVKKRYIDPLVKTSFGNSRISQISSQAKENIDKFISSKWDKYVYSDFYFNDCDSKCV